MDEASRLNEVLQREAPAAARCLSPLGLSAFFPNGVPAQSAEAKGSEINASMGQVTDGQGQPIPLPAMERALDGLDPKVSFLYSPIGGHHALRDKWASRQRQASGESNALASRPIVTLGISRGLSLVAELFADEETEVILADPFWGNYRQIFTLPMRARLRTWPLLRDGRCNVEGFADALAQVKNKAIVVINFPGNPTGYTPSADQIDQIVDVLCSHPGPLVVVLDDAYQGLVYEPGLMRRSLFWELAERADPERLFAVKLDGTTKELFFFAGRVGFLAHTATGLAEPALESKLLGLTRRCTGGPPGPSQALCLAALSDSDLRDQIQSRRRLLGERYRALRDALDAQHTSLFRAWPFNSGCFALLGFERDIDVDALRQRLLRDFGVGTIAFPEQNALRIAYCATRQEDIPVLVERIVRAL